jgi:hypothetical protein
MVEIPRLQGEASLVKIKFLKFKQKRVDNILNLYYLKIMMGEDIEYGEEKLHIGKGRWAFREKAGSILQDIFVVYP